jgi:hypothetical protein
MHPVCETLSTHEQYIQRGWVHVIQMSIPKAAACFDKLIGVELVLYAYFF